MAHAARSLWSCPACGERFTTRNQNHSCGTFDLDALFAKSDPIVRTVFDRFVALIKKQGTVRVIPQKTRIALQTRMRFAAVTPQRSALKGHLVLARRHETAGFVRIDSYSPRCHVHVFRLRSPDDLRPPLTDLIADAYAVGCQKRGDPTSGKRMNV